MPPTAKATTAKASAKIRRRENRRRRPSPLPRRCLGRLEKIAKVAKAPSARPPQQRRPPWRWALRRNPTKAIPKADDEANDPTTPSPTDTTPAAVQAIGGKKDGANGDPTDAADGDDADPANAADAASDSTDANAAPSTKGLKGKSTGRDGQAEGRGPAPRPR